MDNFSKVSESYKTCQRTWPSVKEDRVVNNWGRSSKLNQYFLVILDIFDCLAEEWNFSSLIGDRLKEQRAKVNKKMEFIAKCQKEGPDARGCVSDFLVENLGLFFIKYFSISRIEFSKLMTRTRMANYQTLKLTPLVLERVKGQNLEPNNPM